MLQSRLLNGKELAKHKQGQVKLTEAFFIGFLKLVNLVHKMYDNNFKIFFEDL